MQAPIISFKDFSFQYRAQKQPTLRHINLDIYPGERVLIAGPSGSGKSTLGSCLNGLIPSSYPGTVTGSLTVDGAAFAKALAGWGGEDMRRDVLDMLMEL